MTSDAPARRRRPAEVRALLSEAAAEVFARRGYAAATKRDIADRAGVALSVLDRHFDSKARLFAESVLVPFAEFIEQLNTDWLRQRDAPLSDEPLMHLVITDLHTSLVRHRHALDGLAVARAELDPDIVARLREAFDDLFRQMRLMAELEAERRQWFGAEGLDLTLRLLVGMILGTAAFDWVLLPDDGPDADELIEEMSKLALWGLPRRPPG